MKTDATMEKLKDSFPTAACKTLRVSHCFHTPGGYELKTTKPDTSFATETGRFHLLLTDCRRIVDPNIYGASHWVMGN